MAASLKYSINDSSLRFLLDEKYTEVKNQLIKSIDNKFLAIKIDGATIFKRSIMGINVQFQLNGNIVVKTLAMKEYFVKRYFAIVEPLEVITLLNGYN